MDTKLIIAGGREFTDYAKASAAIDKFFGENHFSGPITIISGTARGADRLGERYAYENEIDLVKYPANWRPNGVFDRGAGHKRNALMADNATHLIAFWDRTSKGTLNMINVASRKGLHVTVVDV